jgi:hypothetical protein
MIKAAVWFSVRLQSRRRRSSVNVSVPPLLWLKTHEPRLVDSRSA